MKTCYFHIGHPKTATSFLQSVMHLNEKLLELAGIWVPGDYRRYGSWNCNELAHSNSNFAGNFGPVFNARVEKNRPLEEALLDHIFASETDVFISTELIFYYKYYVREVVRYANSRGFAVTLVAYLQRQDRAIVPSYCQNIRNHGYSKDLRSFLQETAHVRYFRYHEVISDYSLAPPNRIIVRTFEPEHLVGGDIIADFLSATGMDIPLDAIKCPGGRANPSLTLESFEIYRGLNSLGPEGPGQDLIEATLAHVQPGESRRAVDAYYTSEIAE